jgi:hypothetical protein
VTGWVSRRAKRARSRMYRALSPWVILGNRLQRKRFLRMARVKQKDLVPAVTMWVTYNPHKRHKAQRWKVEQISAPTANV